MTLNNGIGAIAIGGGSRIGIGSTVMGPVEVGADTITGQNVLITGLIHNYEAPDLPIKDQGTTAAHTTIGDGCFIGTNACIMPGVSIGDHCVIGAGCVVTRDVPSYHIAAGNPARLIKKFDTTQQKWISL